MFLIFDSLYQITNYEKEVEEMKHMTRQEFVAAIRRCFIVSSFRPWSYLYIYKNSLFKRHLYICVSNHRKSSGFSRGASMYRGVTRFIYSSFLKSIDNNINNITLSYIHI